MIRVEQLVYTTAAPDPMPGYRVVAKSPGITDRIVSDLNPYMLPAGIDPRNFGQSKSMVVVEGGRQVAYGLSRNIGYGPDGRPDAMSSHTLVIDAKGFEALSCDSRALDGLFTDRVPAEPMLPSIEVPEDAAAPRDRGIDRARAPLLARTLHALVRGRRVAVRGASGVQFVQDALGILPPSLRLVPFSTCMVDLDLQPAYRLVLLGDSPAGSLPRGFDVVDGRPRKPLTASETGRAVRYMVAMASVRGPDLAALHAAFEKATALPPRKRLAVLTAALRMAQSPGAAQSDRDAQMSLDHLARLDPAELDEILSGLGIRAPPNGRPGLAGLVRERHALRNISGYGANRHSIEELLGQADSEGRQGLLAALYESKKSEVAGNIGQLFGDFTYSYYNADFFRFVASVPALARRFKEFAGMRGKNQFRRQAAVRLFVRASMESGDPSLIEPAIFKPYDLDSGYDLDSFGSLLSDVFSSAPAAKSAAFCAAVATAGLSYMAGFGGSYGAASARPRRRSAERFGALAGRLGRMALAGGDSPHGKRASAKASGQIVRMMRECGIAASGVAGRPA